MERKRGDKVPVFFPFVALRTDLVRLLGQLAGRGKLLAENIETFRTLPRNALIAPNLCDAEPDCRLRGRESTKITSSSSSIGWKLWRTEFRGGDFLPNEESEMLETDSRLLLRLRSRN